MFYPNKYRNNVLNSANLYLTKLKIILITKINAPNVYRQTSHQNHISHLMLIAFNYDWVVFVGNAFTFWYAPQMPLCLHQKRLGALINVKYTK